MCRDRPDIILTFNTSSRRYVIDLMQLIRAKIV